MAYIQKRGKTWFVQIQRKGIRRSATFNSKIDAVQWAADNESAIVAGKQKTIIPNLTFGELLDRYVKEVSSTKRGEKWERIRIKKIKSDPIAKIKLQELSETHIAEWRDRRLKCVSNATVRREWNLLSSACSIAVKEWKWLEKHPMRDVRRPKAPQGRDRRITHQEEESILHCIGYDRNSPPNTQSARVGAAFLFAIETAMRVSEITGLAWDKVDVNKRTAHLEQTKNDTRRTVPLSSEAVRILEQLRFVCRGESVFDIKSGNLDALFRKAKTKAMIEDLHFHDTRHEAITRLASKLEVLELARMVGHQNLKQLLTYYNATPEELAKKLG